LNSNGLKLRKRQWQKPKTYAQKLRQYR